ncbi:MAG TPA: hypothetical protein VKV26_25190 [Dehalococcoidia bacterium]|nr:hypothetical protein [Dehalococcoidia bacterium]
MVRATQPKTKRRREPRLPKVEFLSLEEARALYDEIARRELGMSGDEFIAAWNRGDYNFDPDYSEAVCQLWILMPMGLERE